jgi:hypothetical protein
MGVRGVRVALGVAVLVLAGCQIVQVETPDPAAVPSGSLEATGSAAIGPIVELGSGSSEGIGWRAATFESAEGWCLQLEMQAVTESGCGQVPPEEDAAIGMVMQSGSIVHGVASEETATVFLIIDSLGRVPATLMGLDDAGLDGQAFVGIAPADANVTHVMAVKLNGEILQTYELP